MVVANWPLAPLYDALIGLPVEVRIGALKIAKPLLLWINDGLMAVFFFLVGLELKRELLAGQLSDPKEIVLPALGAFGGMLCPAVIYIWVNQGNSAALQGWAIPAATDIAFALAILALLGRRVPGRGGHVLAGALAAQLAGRAGKDPIRSYRHYRGFHPFRDLWLSCSTDDLAGSRVSTTKCLVMSSDV